MSVDLKNINLTLLTAFKNSNFIIVGEKALQAANATKLQSESLLESDQTISGIKSISNINVAPSIAQLDTVIPATNVNDSDDSDINLITGSRSSSGRLNTVIGSASPQAVGKSLATVTGKSAFTYRNELKSIAVDDAKSSVNDIDNILTKGVDQHVGLSNSISLFNIAFNSGIGQRTDSLLGNCILNIQKGIFPIIDEVSPNISKADKDETVRLLLADRKREAAQLLEKNSKAFDATQIEEKINEVPISQKEVLNDVDKEAIGTKSTQDYEIASGEGNWKGNQTPVNSNTYTFDIVGTKEELITEFRESTRDITEFVTHWTGTFTNQNIGAREVHSWHLDRGFNGCGYHYVIQRDGKLQRGRPLNIRGAHSKAYGHNNYSIGVTFVGGFNCPSGTPNPERFLSSDSFTEEQWNTYAMFVESFYTVWPGGQAWGHNDTTDQGKIDPGFDVQQYVYNEFNKENIYADGQNPGSALTSTQLEKARTRII
jgi:N-acetylmuramoyl-L-alanine amidase